MADEKVNVSPEESKTSEALAPSGPGDSPAPEHTEGPAVPGGDQTVPAHAEPAAGEHTQQTVFPGMGEDAPAPSGKVINLSDIQAADKGGKEASTTAPEKKAPEADQPKKRRGRPPKEQAAVSAGKKAKAAEPRTGRPSKVDKAAREEAPPSVRDKVSRGKKADKGKETGSGGAPASKSAKTVKPGKAAPVKEAAVPPPEIKLPPTPETPPRPVEEGKIVYLKMPELHPLHTFRKRPYKVQDDIGARRISLSKSPRKWPRRPEPASAMKRPISGGPPGTRHSIPWTVRTGSNTPPACMSPRPRSFWSAWSRLSLTVAGELFWLVGMLCAQQPR